MSITSIEELEEELGNLFTNFQISEGKNGEIIIHTGLKEDALGELVALEDSEDDDDDFEDLESLPDEDSSDD